MWDEEQVCPGDILYYRPTTHCDTPIGMSNLFREIHKNAWLKRINTDKKLPVTKKEKFWVVFCVHDDFEALLEGYQEPRFAPLHQPDWTLSLQTTQHISHTLVPTTDTDYEFVITLTNSVARFTASSWDAMQEWVSTLRSKLREMKIMSPKENLYSRLPEIKQPLLPTRDPMSPLPAPPPVPAALVPGIEPLATVAAAVPMDTPTPSQDTSHAVIETEDISSAAPVSPPCSAMSNTLTQNLLNMLSDPIVNLTNRLAAQDEEGSSSSESFLDRPSTSHVSTTLDATTVQTTRLHDPTDSDTSLSSSSPSSSLARTFTANVLNNNEKRTKKKQQRKESSSSSSDSFKSLAEITPLVIPRPQTSKPQAVVNGTATEEAATTSNITIIQVSDPVVPEGTGLGPTTASSTLSGDTTTFMANIEVNGESADTTATTQTVRVTSPKLITPATSSQATSGGGYDEIRNLETGVTNISVGAILIQSSATAAVNTDIPSINNNNYEQVFIGDRNNNNNRTTPAAPMPYSVFLLSRQPRSASHVELTTPQRRQVQVNGGNSSVPVNIPAGNNNAITVNGTSQEASSSNVSNNNNIPESSSRSSRPENKSTNARVENGRGTRESPSRAAGEQQQAARSSRQRRGVEQETRKRSSSTSGDHRSSNPLQSVGHPRITSPPRVIANGSAVSNNNNNNNSNAPRSGRISLREQQVLQLRREIQHPGGVRLQLRRKDCVGSIALVDAFNSVWIAGWKQKEHPMLYNALHIGDRLVSVGGVALSGATSAAEVNKMIRGSQSAYIELIVRRVPFGRVYAIRRDLDGQCLGLIRESNTATIVDIIPNGLAARHGLPVKAKTVDGLSLTFYVLTEINGRPLNLFYKDTEIQDRLNAVGRDISILVQPLDLITKLKKQLKAMRGYKDFIVQ